jgi:hypothetical protein
MRDDPILALERELLSAAERLIADERRRRRASSRALALAAAAILPVVLVAGLFLAIHHGNQSAPAPAGGPGGSGPMAQIVGVLRRPQTPLERSGIDAYTRRTMANQAQASHGSFERSSLRRVNVVVPEPGGPAVRLPLELAVVDTPEGQQLIVQDNIVRTVDGGQLDSSDSGDPESVGAVVRWGVFRSLGPDNGGATAVAVLVPDGVARVRLTVGGQTRTAPVRDNTAGFRVPSRDWSRIYAGAKVTWYDAAGTAINTVRPRLVTSGVMARIPRQ